MPSTAENRQADRVGGNLAQRLRTRQTRALIAAALTGTLLLSGASALMDRLHSGAFDALNHPADPLTDAQSKAQVVEPARQIVSLSGWRVTSAGYALLSCENREDPPYQGAIYLTFAVPADVRADTYLATVASTLSARGWEEGISPNNHAFARTFTKGAATVIFYRQDDDPSEGVARIYGQCRDMNDHRNDVTAWTDVTDQIRTG